MLCRRSKCLALNCIMLGAILTSGAKADLTAHWQFNEGSGSAVQDSSGNGHHGTTRGASTWGPGPQGFKTALEFGPGMTEAVDCGIFDPTNGTGQLSVSLWANWNGSGDFQHFLTKSNGWGAATMMFQVELWGAHTNATFTDRVGISYQPAGSVPFSLMPKNEWTHLAFAFDGTNLTLYLNGVDEDGPKSFSIGPDVPAPVLIGQNEAGARIFNGFLDDVQIHDRALSQAEVQQIMVAVPPGMASDAHPEDGAADVPRDTVLSWTPGTFVPSANGHVVYMGENFDDVNDASGGATQDAASYDPGRLAFDTTYYWRVDEVNGPPDFSIYQGNVWSFTTEPISIPIRNVTATAPSSFGTSLPENTTNGSGLVDDLHGTSAGDMWISTGIPATIEYSFDRVYKLHELWVWNSNQLIEAFVGFGAKDIVIEHSLDGEHWTALEGVGPLAQAPGAEGYAHNNTIDFGGAAAQHVRLTVNSVQGIAPQASLSEVRFFAIPTLATRPSPESRASDVSADVTLAWDRDGREVDRHEVYFGTDPDNLPLAGTVTESSFDTGALGLLLGETYHWRVDEVNEAMDPSTWQGSLWSFSTAESIVVDDMESYEDKEFLEIWATWVDGFEDPANGSLVGNGAAGVPETAITHGGGQSLPLHYDNTGAGLSEATRTFAPAQDWTIGSPETLVVHFHGALDNSGGQVYVKINNVKVTYDANPSAISSPFWTQWNIDLSGVGMVNSLTIGVEGAGAQGILYVDDIVLYRQAPAPVGAQDPGTDNLVAYYALDNNAQDGSGNGHNGTLEGSPIYVSPGWDGTGACLQFGPQDARITVESFDVTGSGITLAAWVNPSLFTNDARMISKSEGGGTNFHYWAMVLSGGGENNLQFRLRTDVGNTTSRTSGGNALMTDEWTHVAVAWDAADPVMRQYKNGQEIDSVDKAGTAVATGPGVKIGIGNQSISADSDGAANLIRPFDGLIDEVRVYDRGLSSAEMLSVAFGQ